MTPSSVVEIADEAMTLTEFRQHERYQTFSRIPVYKDDKDDYITGYVLRQTILEKLSEDKFSMQLSELVRPILSFQETESVSTIWERLLEKKEHISVIIDEYGCLRGIVTMEDVIETCWVQKSWTRKIPSLICKPMPASSGLKINIDK